ncbi:hypothetical protein [Marinifilum sp.]|uniref:hypothetical protein n=1 Tax=Marinifilum sp. TaxID=2033137 RepID=UPI003BA8C27B
MQTYTTPDPFWASFNNTQTHQQFIQNYVIQGRFHSLVPDDIVKDYKVVEYILASSYFHYPLFDEAFRKLAAMFEMALKLKYKQITNQNWSDRKELNARGKKESNNLNNLIKWLGNKNYLHRSLDYYHAIREFRNFLIHQEVANKGYLLFRNKLIDILNCFNELFIPTEIFENRSKKLEHYKQEIDKLFQKTVSIYHNGKNIHYKSIEVLYYLENRLILRFTPFYSEVKCSEQSMTCPEDLIVTIKDFSFQGKNLIGSDPNNENPILISPSNQTISQLEIEKTIEFHKSHFTIPYYGALQKKINDYLNWELYQANCIINL